MLCVRWGRSRGHRETDGRTEQCDPYEVMVLGGGGVEADSRSALCRTIPAAQVLKRFAVSLHHCFPNTRVFKVMCMVLVMEWQEF